jgi:hypothetical protein
VRFEGDSLASITGNFVSMHVPERKSSPRDGHAETYTAMAGGLWPMMRPGAVSGATRALRCLWHEVRVDERTVRYKAGPLVENAFSGIYLVLHSFTSSGELEGA